MKVRGQNAQISKKGFFNRQTGLNNTRLEMKLNENQEILKKLVSLKNGVPMTRFKNTRLKTR